MAILVIKVIILVLIVIINFKLEMVQNVKRKWYKM